MERLISLLGPGIDVVRDGRSALDMLESNEYDLIISDFSMPGMSGDHLVQIVKGRYPDLPIVIVSGWPPSEVRRALENQTKPDAIKQKPITINDVKDILERFLRM